jgi:hypothetical protein
LISLIIVVGVALAALIVALGVWLAAVTVRSALKARQKHDPIEYYAGWGGYRHPIALEHKITKEQADALAAEGSAYLTGYFDANGKLVRVVVTRLGLFRIYVYLPSQRKTPERHGGKKRQSDRIGIRQARPWSPRQNGVLNPSASSPSSSSRRLRKQPASAPRQMGASRAAFRHPTSTLCSRLKALL